MRLSGLDAERGARAERRLRDETLVWLTTVRDDGQPQTSPVGFLWDGERLLILSRPGDPKIRNVRGNPKVSLHLDTETDAEDGGVLTLEGEASPDDSLTEPERAAYLDRYGEAMAAEGFDPAEVFAEYSAVLRVAPTRARAY